MKKTAIASSRQVTVLLITAIIIAGTLLVWLVYAQLVAPRLAANIPLDSQACFPSSRLCLSYPSSWKVTEQSANEQHILSVSSADATSQLAIAVGEINTDSNCDQRERRPLYILSSQLTNLVTANAKDVHLVKAITETTADGLFVPAIYLTASDDHRQAAKLHSCALESANVLTLKNNQQLFTGIDNMASPVGSIAPAYRTFDQAKQWLSSPTANISHRILASLQYQ